MIDEGMEFDTALKLAQDLGFAERNPEADVEGHDACRKICILASLAYGKHIYPDNIHTEGITKISLRDVAYAAEYKSVIKLIGDVKKLDNGKIDIYVAPMLIGEKSQLANISDEFNGIMVRGDCTDDVLFYGKGAGSLPTASAVVADIIDSCMHLNERKYIFWADSNNESVLPYNESRTRMYLRLDSPEAEDMVNEIFGNVYVIAKDKELAVATDLMTVADIENNIQKLERKGVKVLSKIRISDL
jgi:homoserine dehydrogenase